MKFRILYLVISFYFLSRQCSPDFIELGGSSELDSVNLATSQTLCGRETKPDKGLTVLCGSSTVRLVSSGEFDNSVTFLVKVIQYRMLE